jgi:hypothetical protein
MYICTYVDIKIYLTIKDEFLVLDGAKIQKYLYLNVYLI